jgi:hypothetical protein
MKTILRLACYLFLMFNCNQTMAQMKNWFIVPEKVDLQSTIVNVTSFAPSTIYADNVANGIYDSGNNLLFYIKDAEVDIPSKLTPLFRVKLTPMISFVIDPRFSF